MVVCLCSQAKSKKRAEPMRKDSPLALAIARVHAPRLPDTRHASTLGTLSYPFVWVKGVLNGY